MPSHIQHDRWIVRLGNSVVDTVVKHIMSPPSLRSFQSRVSASNNSRLAMLSIASGVRRSKASSRLGA